MVHTITSSAVLVFTLVLSAATAAPIARRCSGNNYAAQVECGLYGGGSNAVWGGLGDIGGFNTVAPSFVNSLLNRTIEERSTATSATGYGDQAQVYANFEDGPPAAGGAVTARVTGTVESGLDGRREIGALVARALMNEVELD